MKASRSILFSSLASIIHAATLNVGSGQTYSTITAAYNAASAGDTIYVYPGTYSEQLTISKDSLTIKGSTYPSQDPTANTVTVTHGEYSSAAGSDDGSATLLISGNNFKMYNINIKNSAGDASQAVALSTRGTEMGFYACSFLGWQDTLYTHIGSQFFGRCYIEGAVDFIFGITGNSWFQGCTLAVLKAEGTITAQGRTSSSTTGFYVFNEAKIVLGSGASSSIAGTVYLGRPWGNYAQVVFQNSNYQNIIIPVGWEAWDSTQPTANIFFAEYDNTNAAGTRVSWAKTLSSAESISTILGSTYASWIDSTFLTLGAL